MFWGLAVTLQQENSLSNSVERKLPSSCICMQRMSAHSCRPSSRGHRRNKVQETEIQVFSAWQTPTSSFLWVRVTLGTYCSMRWERRLWRELFVCANSLHKSCQFVYKKHTTLFGLVPLLRGVWLITSWGEHFLLRSFLFHGIFLSMWRRVRVESTSSSSGWLSVGIGFSLYNCSLLNPFSIPCMYRCSGLVTRY